MQIKDKLSIKHPGQKTLKFSFLIGLMLLAFGCGKAPQALSPDGQPNVVFFIVDDLNCRIGCYGDSTALTPNIDRLALAGMRFEKAYCQFPVCNSTRASVFSGLYPTSTGVLDNNTFLVLDEGHETLQDYFLQHGYSLAEFGKVWHGPNRMLRPDDPKPDLSGEKPRRPGWNQDWYTPGERAQQQSDEPDYWKRVHSPYRNLTIPDPSVYAWANQFGPLPDGSRGEDAPIADDAISALQEFNKGISPFFLAVGFHKPHVPLVAPEEYFNLYDVSLMPLPPDFENEVRGPVNTPADELRENIDLYTSRSFSAREAREAIRAYYACVSYVDAQIGRVLDEIDRLGMSDNTIIVLWGDHGWHLSEKGMWAKGTTFEVSSRGPVIIADPRKKTAGSSSPRVVQYLDIYPTLAELCGLGVPAGLEGKSLVPLLENPSLEWDYPAFTVQSREWYIGCSMRTERWRYTEWDQGHRGMMLYDHDNDPHEMHNLAYDPEYSDILEALQRQLRESGVGELKTLSD